MLGWRVAQHALYPGHGRAAQSGAQRRQHDLSVRDGLGSVRQVLDEAGQPLVGSELTYTPFGIPQSGAQPALFGFTGEVQSIETGLVYLRARWYDPASGTFLSRSSHSL
ncbi:MAG: hypothetical protein HC876_07490 [Chloroflexaceae bacterium]|nr:hypothetical protein [Chloroflexaceae bacterium]